MTTDLDKRARELLIQAFKDTGQRDIAEELESLGGVDEYYDPAALRAIKAALSDAMSPTYATPEDIALSKGADDVPTLMVAGAAVARFPAGSWSKVCDALNLRLLRTVIDEAGKEKSDE